MPFGGEVISKHSSQLSMKFLRQKPRAIVWHGAGLEPGPYIGNPLPAEF
jgi:hypothetical protein